MMNSVEWERMINTSDDLAQFLDHLGIWFCYIDDILLIWSGPDGLLQTFVQQLNINTFNLTFTMTSNTNTIEFLDIHIHKDTMAYKPVACIESQRLGMAFYMPPVFTQTI